MVEYFAQVRPLALEGTLKIPELDKRLEDKREQNLKAMPRNKVGGASKQASEREALKVEVGRLNSKR